MVRKSEGTKLTNSVNCILPRSDAYELDASEHKQAQEVRIECADFGPTFNVEGGSLIFDMPGPDEDFDADQREFFRKILRELHAGWRQFEVADSDVYEWGVPHRGSAKTWLLN